MWWGGGVILVPHDLLPAFVNDALANDLDVRSYEGGLPADLSEVRFYVPAYLGGPQYFEALGHMPSLEVCQLPTAGFDHALAHLPDGVTLCNAGGVHDASTAELAVGLMLARLRHIDDMARAMPDGRWIHDTFTSLADRRVVIVGAGGVARAIAERLQPFECDVALVGRSARPGVHAVTDLPDLLPTADVVVLAIPLDDATRGMVDADFLARLRDGALLVNVARGPVVVTDALVAEVRQGRIQAALDVTDPEPLPSGHPLWTLPGVLISPHVGGATSAFLPRMRRLAAAQVRRWRGGEPLHHVVHPARTPASG